MIYVVPFLGDALLVLHNETASLKYTIVFRMLLVVGCQRQSHLKATQAGLQGAASPMPGLQGDPVWSAGNPLQKPFFPVFLVLPAATREKQGVGDRRSR